jgi:ribonuclease HI
MKLTLNIDGGSRGNPGPAAAGVVLRNDDRPVYEAGHFLGRMTNNVAEYRALLIGLDHAARLGATHLQVVSDSELMVRQITGDYRVKSELLAPLYEQAQQKLLRFDVWQIKHVKREHNSRADELANLAMDAGRDVVVISPESPAAEPTAPEAITPPPPTPVWSATIVTIGDKECPAKCPAGRTFVFGPTTPAGLCIHAAQAVFDDEPAYWRERGTKQAIAHCPHCQADIRITLGTEANDFDND